MIPAVSCRSSMTMVKAKKLRGWLPAILLQSRTLPFAVMIASFSCFVLARRRLHCLRPPSNQMASLIGCCARLRISIPQMQQMVPAPNSGMPVSCVFGRPHCGFSFVHYVRIRQLDLSAAGISILIKQVHSTFSGSSSHAELCYRYMN
jgi:hypothetical protein